MRMKADLALLLTAVLWGCAFVAQRVAASHIGVFLFNGLRFLLATLILLPLVRFRKPEQASTLQAVGQMYAPASDAALILSLEAVFAALFGYLLLDEILSSRQLLGCGWMFGAILLAQLKGFGEGYRRTQ